MASNQVSNTRQLPLELCFSPDSQFLTCGGDDGKIRSWSTDKGEEVPSRAGPEPQQWQCVDI